MRLLKYKLLFPSKRFFEFPRLMNILIIFKGDKKQNSNRKHVGVLFWGSQNMTMSKACLLKQCLKNIILAPSMMLPVNI